MPKLKQPRRNPAYAFYDANGVLWLGHTKRDRAGELKQIVDLDSTFRLPSGDAPGQESEGKKGEETKEEGKGGEAEKEQSEETPEATSYYIISSEWAYRWLLFVQGVYGRAPPPIENELLLEKDESGNYVPLPELRIDNAEQEGDFRVVTGPVWSKFCSFYPGSGPEIQLEPALQEQVDSGELRMPWVIDQAYKPPASPPVDAFDDTHKELDYDRQKAITDIRQRYLESMLGPDPKVDLEELEFISPEDLEEIEQLEKPEGEGGDEAGSNDQERTQKPCCAVM